MTWITENWFWILIFAAFMGMHLFGHGGHSGHGSHGGHEDDRKTSGGDPQGGGPQVTETKATSGGHRH